MNPPASVVSARIKYPPGFRPRRGLNWVILGLMICSIVGISFGTYPAWKASNLDPIESLRYE